MENVPIKLNQLEPEFHYFEDNQVLTSGQLNQVVDYFDRQTRLSRTRLMGTGIVCGLQVRLDNNGHVRLSKGTAITTDGDLLHIDDDLVLTQFVKFDDTKAAYPPFWKGNPAAQMDLFRLYTAKAQASQIEGLKDLDDLGMDMNDMAVMLYLNSYLEPPEECTEVGCENRGPRQRQGLTILLVRKDDVDDFASAAGSQLLDLPDLEVARVDLSPKAANPIDTRKDLLVRFHNAIKATSGKFIETMVTACGDAQANKWLFDLVQKAYNKRNPAARWKEQLSSILNVNENQVGVQYVHAFLQDLAMAYEEFRDCIQDLYVDCCPVPGQYAKHVMVQEVVKQPDPFGRSDYRYYFCENPILSKEDRRYQKAMFLHRRMDQMIQNFNLPTQSRSANEVRITPDEGYHVALGNRPIPFYYKNNRTLIEHWNYAATRKGRSNTVMGYHQHGKAVAAPSSRHPFSFAHNADFYRVEGHMGLPLEDAEQRLEQLRQTHNLGFKIESVLVEKKIGLIKIPGRIKFPSLSAKIDIYRYDLFDSFNSVRSFSRQLKNIEVDDAAFSEDMVLSNEIVNAKAKTRDFEDSVVEAQEKLYGNVKAFGAQFATFKTSYKKAIEVGNDIKEKIHHTAQTTHEIPLQKFVLSNKFWKLDRVIKEKEEKERKVREQLIFENFIKQNPGLEHLGGVPKGGTFVLLYTMINNKKTVIADCCLPYVGAIDEDPEIDFVKPDIGVVDDNGRTYFKAPADLLLRNQQKNFPWVKRFDQYQIPNLTSKLRTVEAINTKVSGIRSDFDTFKGNTENIAQINSRVNTFFDTAITTISKVPRGTGSGAVGGGADFDFGSIKGNISDMIGKNNTEVQKWIKAAKDDVGKDITVLRGDVKKNQDDVSGIKGTLPTLKTDVTKVSNEMSSLQTEMGRTKGILDEVKTDLQNTKRKVNENKASFDDLSQK
jgi:hypothetical protein